MEWYRWVRSFERSGTWIIRGVLGMPCMSHPIWEFPPPANNDNKEHIR
jgi:hypothetical protein